MAISKVILDGSTLLDVTNSTVNAQRILSGYVAKGADGVDVTGAYVPQTSNDFVVTLTEDGDGVFQPDCTWSELMAARSTKNVVFTAGGTMGCSWDYDGPNSKVTYTVYIPGDTGSYEEVFAVNHEWTSSGVTMVGYDEYPDTSVATAVAADVASGKTFFGASGYGTGTASGGGGDDSNYAHTISRSGAITSIPSGITAIGAYAFRGCTGLSVSSLPSGVTSIGTYAFYGCTGMPLSSLPSGITIIDAYTFIDCDLLTVSTLPSGVTYIGTSAFQRCPSMTSIQGSGAITTIASSSFLGSSAKPSALRSVKFPNANISGSLSTAFGSTTAANACQQLEEADVGKVATISANAFANCHKLQTLVLRHTSGTALANVSAFTNTPFSGYNGLTGTVYVPSSLIASYQTATNWSTLYNGGTLTFSAIEGSVWEL